MLRGTTVAGAPVVVYTHVADLPTEELRLQLEAHADVMQMVTHPAIARFVELIDLPTRAALVAEAPVGRALDELSMLSYSVVDILQIAIDVAPALAELHVHGVGHGAISAHTISLRDGDAVLAAPWTLGSRRSPPDDLGALSRLLDDLMLQAGHQVPAGLRAVLDAGYRSAAGDGYRSVVGFVHDLARCRDELRATNMCSAFPLAVHRFALTWRDPARAIGVEPQLTTLAEAVAAAELKGRPCVLVIEGPSGAGRTTLLAAFEQWLVERRIMHARAKFATGGSRGPLAGPRDLVASAVARVQAAPHGTRQRVIEALQQRIGGNVAMAVQLAPSLSMLLGEHPEPGEGSAVDLAAHAEVTAKAVIGTFRGDRPVRDVVRRRRSRRPCVARGVLGGGIARRATGRRGGPPHRCGVQRAVGSPGSHRRHRGTGATSAGAAVEWLGDASGGERRAGHRRRVGLAVGACVVGSFRRQPRPRHRRSAHAARGCSSGGRPASRRVELVRRRAGEGALAGRRRAHPPAACRGCSPHTVRCCTPRRWPGRWRTRRCWRSRSTDPSTPSTRCSAGCTPTSSCSGVPRVQCASTTTACVVPRRRVSTNPRAGRCECASVARRSHSPALTAQEGSAPSVRTGRCSRRRSGSRCCSCWKGTSRPSTPMRRRTTSSGASPPHDPRTAAVGTRPRSTSNCERSPRSGRWRGSTTVIARSNCTCVPPRTR